MQRMSKICTFKGTVKFTQGRENLGNIKNRKKKKLGDVKGRE